jgi:hypothetical protein
VKLLENPQFLAFTAGVATGIAISACFILFMVSDKCRSRFSKVGRLAFHLGFLVCAVLPARIFGDRVAISRNLISGDYTLSGAPWSELFPSSISMSMLLSIMIIWFFAMLSWSFKNETARVQKKKMNKDIRPTST